MVFGLCFWRNARNGCAHYCPPSSERAWRPVAGAVSPWCRTGGPGSGLLGFPEDLGDLVDLGEQLAGRGGVGAALGSAGSGELGGFVEELVEVGVLLEVRWLEVVGPQHPQVVLD